jgi:hypothetical protein
MSKTNATAAIKFMKWPQSTGLHVKYKKESIYFELKTG